MVYFEQLYTWTSTTTSYRADIEQELNSASDLFETMITSDEGITVPGSQSNQKFSIGYVKELEPNSNVIILRLAGTRQGVEVEKPITGELLLPFR